MDIVFFTRLNKLKDIQITLDLSELTTSNDIATKKIGENTIYIAFDGNAAELSKEYESYLFLLMDKIIKNDDYFIVYHTNQAPCITEFINDKVDSSRCELDEHTIGNVKYYNKIPELLNEEGNALENWVEELKLDRVKKYDLRDRLIILHKLLNGSTLGENEKEFVATYEKLLEKDKTEALSILRSKLLEIY